MGVNVNLIVQIPATVASLGQRDELNRHYTHLDVEGEWDDDMLEVRLGKNEREVVFYFQDLVEALRARKVRLPE